MSLVAVLILLAAHTAPATAQQKAQTVSGTVLDPDDNPLIGATVVVVKGTQGAVTDVKGKFTIKAKPSDSLQISYLGYKTETLNVGSRTNFTVRMEKDSSTDIDEIVVIGYGQVAKKDLTGSVATVKMNDIKDVPVLSVDNALQGRIAGADFMSTTGEPGATTTIRIRGTRSINASNEPLIVVLRFVLLQRHRRYHPGQRPAAFHGTYQPRTPVVQMDESRLYGFVHLASQRPEQILHRRNGLVQQRPVSVTAAQAERHV